ncbi:HK97-gp10 family putative phage morphogenesis protein [Agrobacterium tumefaciens]|uniref:HK97-gp10 family putative phage morphogenesis protein n=1 Tax=Agrobacterium tumefaciens TaxID=358 RepID=UPI0021CFC5E0|nr:HK97-gp10 family putative phage morphogenesis protein [Agrobacterium tumefaciens]UXT96532.1 HK97 gp10 family phage protein [Agrobacterium tumefaciens]
MANRTADHIKRVLAAVPKAAKAAIQPAIDQGANEMMMRMRYLAPKDDGDLQRSIRVEPGPRELSATVTAGGPLTTKPVRKSEKGNAPEYDYALGVEYGTEEMTAQPFFWPSVNTTKKRVKRRIDRAIGKAIKEAWSKS